MKQSVKLNLRSLKDREGVMYSDNQQELNAFVPALNLDHLLDKCVDSSYLTISMEFQGYEMWLLKEQSKLGHVNYLLFATVNGDMKARAEMFDVVHATLNECGIQEGDKNKKLNLLLA